MPGAGGGPSVPAMPRSAPLALSALALLLAPAAAQAATKTVYAGPPVAKAKAMPPDSTGNAFYPRNVAVDAGGKVAFKIGGLHNVIFAPKGKPIGAFHAPDPARPVAGTGRWFDGRPGWFIDPAHVMPSGDKVVDGKALDASGVFQGQGAPPDYVVKFPKVGRYDYVCTIHPGMKGSVKVVRKHARSKPKAVAKQIAATVKAAERLADDVPAGNVVRAGNDRREVAFLSFFPATREVQAGAPVRFEMSKDSTEMHNVVFGPEAVLAETAAKFISPGAQGIAYDPVSVYPSASGPLSHPGGEAFVGTGMLDADPRTSFPAAATVTFTQPGSYAFICTVHGPSMKGRIDVG